MKKTSLLLILILCALRVFPRDSKTTTLTFTANAPCDIYHPFNSVNVTNVTRGWTETLVYPDTVLVLKNTTCIVSPNPFSLQTNVRFQMSKEGRAAFVVCNINGQILASAESWLSQGMHNLTIALEKPQYVILSINTPIDRYAIKLLQTGHGNKNEIMIGTDENWDIISMGECELGKFEIGDIMSYEAILEDEYDYNVSSEIITKAQFDNDTITLHFSFPIGAIDGLFSVSETQRVWFSRGNLQYQASSNSWKFADHQYDYMGINNTNVSSSYSGWIDLFGWGTSGFDHGALCYQPWSVNCNDKDYLAYGQWSFNLNDQSGQADWGYNAISNGNNTTQTWRSLSYAEWQYLLDERTSPSGIRYAKAKVNDVNGVILLPDSWNESYYELNNFNQSDASFSCNVINASQWSTLEQYGAIFLPAAGYRHGIEIYDVNYIGGYRSSSVSSESNIWRLRFFDDGLYMDECEDGRCDGQSVRLVYSSMVYDPSVVAQPPTVTTTEVINIKTSTTSGGVVSSDGGSSVIERGICWSTNHNPTIEDDHVSNGFGTGVYSANMHGLVEDTTYYVRAYAINSAGVAYGNELGFTYHDWSDGVLPGVFSVSNTKKVKFSQGNLQYKASTRTWRFAEDQFEYIGEANSNISSHYDGYIDLFGWATSGCYCGNTYYQPWDSNTCGGVLYGPPGLHSLTGLYASSDWGYSNAISNGGNQNHQWRTLTMDEWRYVFNTRSTTSGIRYAKAKVNNVNGVILLPDNWSSSYYTLYSTNDIFSSFSSNDISSSTWTYSLEAHGAVFLPAAGDRLGTSVSNVGRNGNYWSASCYNKYSALKVLFGDWLLVTGYDVGRDYGLSVRLVKDIQP